MTPFPVAAFHGLTSPATGGHAVTLAPILRRWAACILVAVGLLPAHAATLGEVLFQPQVAGVALVQGQAGSGAGGCGSGRRCAACRTLAGGGPERVSGQPARSCRPWLNCQRGAMWC